MKIRQLLSRFQAPADDLSGGGSSESPAGSGAPVEVSSPDQSQSPEPSADTIADEIAKDFGYEPPEEQTGETGEEQTAAPGKEAPAAAAEKPETPAATGLEAPSSWREEVKAEWAKLPPLVQEEVLRREQNFHDGVKQYQTAANVGQAFTEIANPYLDYYQRAGGNIYDAAREAVQFHATLSFGTPEQKIGALHEIAARLGFDLGAIGQGQPNGLPPIVGQLLNRINQLESGVGQVTTEVQRAQSERLETEIMGFANEKLDDGNLRHPYFWEVVQEMRSLFDTGQVKNIKDAYEKAIWLNPTVRQKEVDRIAAVREQQKRRDAQQRADRARRASAANVRSIESSGRATPPVNDDLDATLSETLRDIRSRG